MLVLKLSATSIKISSKYQSYCYFQKQEILMKIKLAHNI